jgi:UDP-N-acetylglucosamine 2-epimerase (non-hydrolysing)/GDP/UDP-N,N'-diacetylbacillosamine 2-epimerase (hydrolysing)
MGKGLMGFAKAYERLRPDILVVLGDRFEILAAVSAAIPFRIPVAHISGGESTEGAIDEPIRHAITKMSHVHFTTTELYRKRVIQMGEDPDNVYSFGAPGIDSIFKLSLMNRERLCETLGIASDKRLGVVTYHPVTLEKDTAQLQISEVLKAIEAFSEIFWVFTLPNADTGGRIIIKKIEDFIAEHRQQGKLFSSLGQLVYLSLMKQVDIMVGNSSSGLLEAPSFELPVVNIGDRQRGRVRASNVIDIPDCRENLIKEAIRNGLSNDFRKSLKGLKNPYGEGDTSAKIIAKLKTVAIGQNLIKKKFHEIQEGAK